MKLDPTALSSSLSVSLARPLEEDWRPSLESVARAHRWPTIAEPAQLGALVRALSEAYNAPVPPPGRAVASSGPSLAARLGFSFARDVPKGAAAVAELVASGALGGEGAAGKPPLRVLDIGSGLGATTWGVARALAAAGIERVMKVTWSDEDQLALDVASQLAQARESRCGSVKLDIHTERKRASTELAGRGPWDLILLGQVISELDSALDPGDRAARHAHVVEGLVAKLAPGGAVVIVEPALRDRTRHLHAIRDSVLKAGAASVFAPCLHASACPVLAVPGEWCHEDLAIDLPPWLEPVAKAAGLRWQGLTFSYLVLRRPDEKGLAQLLPASPGARARVVSDPLVSKGKREHFVCGEDACRTRISRLDRDEADPNATWSSLGRGALIAIDPLPEPPKHRIAKESRVTRLEPVSEGAPPPHPLTPSPPRE